MGFVAKIPPYIIYTLDGCITIVVQSCFSNFRKNDENYPKYWYLKGQSGKPPVVYSLLRSLPTQKNNYLKLTACHWKWAWLEDYCSFRLWGPRPIFQVQTSSFQGVIKTPSKNPSQGRSVERVQVLSSEGSRSRERFKKHNWKLPSPKDPITMSNDDWGV